MEPSTKPSLFLAERAMVIERFQAENPTPLKTFETSTELGLSDEVRKNGLEWSIELFEFPIWDCDCKLDMMKAKMNNQNQNKKWIKTSFDTMLHEDEEIIWEKEISLILAFVIT